MNTLISKFSLRSKTNVAILVAALGYFVDVYDLLLFSIVRTDSLRELGVADDQLLTQGIYLLNIQMIGMLIGGVLWGIWGDKRGRIQVLFGSILLYSLANIANAYVTTVPIYALMRFIAGVGLAGEIGAGITLISELMSKHARGYGTTLVATVGVSGSLVAGIVGEIFTWRTSYIIGGVMGLLLLLLRVSVAESGIFDQTKKQELVVRGDLRMLFGSWDRTSRYFYCILVGVPIWFVVGIIATFSPEIGLALGLTEPVRAAKSVMCYSIGLTIGDLASGLFSQFFQNRKKVMSFFIAMTLVFSIIILNLHGASANTFYATFIPLGFFIGYWAVFVSTAAEQFGTNLRATVTTTVPNFVRGTTVLMTLLLNTLKGQVGVLVSAQFIGLLVCAFALLALKRMRETFALDLNFVEVDGGTQDLTKAESVV